MPSQFVRILPIPDPLGHKIGVVEDALLRPQGFPGQADRDGKGRDLLLVVLNPADVQFRRDEIGHLGAREPVGEKRRRVQCGAIARQQKTIYIRQPGHVLLQKNLAEQRLQHPGRLFSLVHHAAEMQVSVPPHKKHPPELFPDVHDRDHLLLRRRVLMSFGRITGPDKVHQGDLIGFHESHTHRSAQKGLDPLYQIQHRQSTVMGDREQPAVVRPKEIHRIGGQFYLVTVLKLIPQTFPDLASFFQPEVFVVCMVIHL